MKTLFETSELIVTHDAFKACLIADCEHAIARLPWNARTSLQRIKTESMSAFEASVSALGGFISTKREV